MSKIARIAVLVTALASVLGAMSSTAGAVTWHNTGSTAFTATAGPSTVSVGANSTSCTGASADATAPATSTATTFPLTWTVRYFPCTIVGQASYWHCHYIVTYFSTSTPPHRWSILYHRFCVKRLTANNTALCTLEGSSPGTYTSPNGATPGAFTLDATSTLTMTHASGSSCVLGTGTASSTEQTFTVTAGTPTSLGPVVTRTP